MNAPALFVGACVMIALGFSMGGKAGPMWIAVGVGLMWIGIASV